MKAYLRISGAVLMGAILVVGALLLPKEKRADAGDGVVVTQAEQRVPIDTDTDGDGQPDWEKMLAARIVDTIELPASSTESGSGTYVKPTTFTGRFSESFFEEYMNSKAGGAVIDDPTPIVEKAIASIEASTRSTTYTAGDLVIVENSSEAAREYGTQIAAVMQTQPAAGEHEIQIFGEAMQKNDPHVLKKLDLIEEAYRNLTALTLQAPTPAAYVPFQIRLVNSYEALRFDVFAMKESFTDPLFSLARVKEHLGDTQALFDVIKEIQDQLLLDGVVYSEDEVGSFLYVFKL